jgi:hypothetical protein
MIHYSFFFINVYSECISGSILSWTLRCTMPNIIIIIIIISCCCRSRLRKILRTLRLLNPSGSHNKEIFSILCQSWYRIFRGLVSSLLVHSWVKTVSPHSLLGFCRSRPNLLILLMLLLLLELLLKRCLFY